MNNIDNKNFKKRIRKLTGFKPSNLSLYRNAFVHRSATYNNHKGEIINNERLEFLGDAILDAIISEYLYKKYPNEHEGFLTKTRSKIVNTKKLASISHEFQLFRFLQTHTEHKLNKEHLCADTFEAFIGAIYLDKGYRRTKKFVINRIVKEIIDLNSLIQIETNHKSSLIEWSQKKNKIIIFETTEHKDELNIFVAKVLLDKKEIAEGYGKTKKEAEQMSALLAMKKINPAYNNGNENNKHNKKL